MIFINNSIQWNMPRCKHVFFTLNYVNLHSFIHINIQVFLVLLKSYFEILGKEKVFKRSSTVIHIMHSTRTRRDDYFPFLDHRVPYNCQVHARIQIFLSVGVWGIFKFSGGEGGGGIFGNYSKFKKFEFSRGIVSEPPTLPPDPNSRSAQAHENNHPEKM